MEDGEAGRDWHGHEIEPLARGRVASAAPCQHCHLSFTSNEVLGNFSGLEGGGSRERSKVS